MKALVSLSFLALLTGCASGPSKKQVVDFTNKVDAEKIKTQKDLGNSSNRRLPLKAGQWVKIHTVMKGEDANQSLSTFKVLKVSGKTVTMEVETTNVSTQTPQIMQYEVENYPAYERLDINKVELEKLVDKMKIKKIIMKQGNEPAQEISAAYMPMAKGLLKQLFAGGYSIGGNKSEPCASDYFKGGKCIVFDYEASAYGFTTKGTSYAHSAVPIVGFIKSVADNSETFVVNFGLTGATSSL